MSANTVNIQSYLHPAQRMAMQLPQPPLVAALLLVALLGCTSPMAALGGVDNKPVAARRVEVSLDYVRSVKVVETVIFDFPHKTLLVDFKRPMRVISTLEGQRGGIMTVGNHYYPPPCWGLGHRLGFEKWRDLTLRAIGKSRVNGSFLFTGADVENLSVQRTRFKEMSVCALVTAGVETNAVRASVDEGMFYEPGTINIILMANRKLSPRAMARAIITATEAKTAAMQDLDIRSSSGCGAQATGTGTDEIIVVEGAGSPIDNAGGHCKIGELMARAVYDGVKEAVSKQNGITARRSVFRRLRERRIDLRGELAGCAGPRDEDAGRCLARLEELLLDPRYASFMEAAFALSDASERGLVADLDAFHAWGRCVAEEIAGSKLEKWRDGIVSEQVPIVIRMALNALLNGVLGQERPFVPWRRHSGPF